MGEQERFIAFRELLHKAMDGYSGTQAEFARASGLSPETLNRMINSEYISKPQKMTLRKIAGQARNGVTYEMLCEACGYAVQIEQRTNQQRLEDFKNNFISRDLKALTNGFYNSIDDYVQAAIAIYSEEEISYSISEPMVVTKDDSANGEDAVVISFSFLLSETETIFADVVVFFTETKSGRFYINTILTDTETLLRYDSSASKHYVQQFGHNEQCVLVKVKTKKYESISPEERLLHMIFGGDTKRQRITVAGLGFALCDLPEERLREFIVNHKDSFCKTPKEKQIFNDFVLDGDDRHNVFSRYKTVTSTGAGEYSYRAAIVNIIYREQGINTQGWGKEQVQNYEDVDFIMYSVQSYDANETEKNLSKDKLIQILDEYARELMSEVHEYHLVIDV